MLCHQARRRLDSFHWCSSNYEQDAELAEHLRQCTHCYSLVQAEEALRNDLGVLQRAEPEVELSLDAVKEKAESAGNRLLQSNRERRSLIRRLGVVLALNTRQRFAIGAIALLFGFIALVPFNFKEKVGYQIAIDGVEREVAMDNQKITALLGALGMEEDKASTLLDSLGANQVRFSVGECSETCRLTISDLKTERDVTLMVRAIIELGCCRIDDIVPIFRNESTSLLGLAARKLLS